MDGLLLSPFIYDAMFAAANLLVDAATKRTQIREVAYNVACHFRYYMIGPRFETIQLLSGHPARSSSTLPFWLEEEKARQNGAP